MEPPFGLVGQSPGKPSGASTGSCGGTIDLHPTLSESLESPQGKGRCPSTTAFTKTTKGQGDNRKDQGHHGRCQGGSGEFDRAAQERPASQYKVRPEGRSVGKEG